ncbi:hypothetical protein [Halomicrobium mukohataei]|uniref:Uncharacterized protein n=2 Tax=Halomicrobium mukohataei TaxID=57705 RepID=C7P519_HALMD|nr:hypothetical protein [Halomicrobium mukohataei]ACV49414.1 hypothetical protein Hmuk_3322 [Halomicrobium mukohataei DSM 12286]QCD67240.1 hypothetical protein E5139_16480 [Halomicrobium mukohataei]
MINLESLNRHRFGLLATMLLLVGVVLGAAIAASFVYPRPPPEQPASLHVHGELEQDNETVVFDGRAELHGGIMGDSVKGVRVLFYNTTAIYRTVQVGTLIATTGNDSAWKSPITITLAQTPAHVTIEYESFNNADQRPLVTEGLRQQNGTLVPDTGS